MKQYQFLRKFLRINVPYCFNKLLYMKGFEKEITSALITETVFQNYKSFTKKILGRILLKYSI